jgi:hypothetical protein
MRPVEAELAEIAARPGIDPRRWLTEGTVEPGDDALEFDSDFGAPLVNVTLQPSKVQVRCRVLMQAAGNGEGEWHPFVAGDHVLVGIVNGNERSCVILGRLNNAIDKFPENVAGQDPRTNTFGFVRRRSPYLAEYAGPWIVRQATTGALLSIDSSGVVTVREGSGAALQLTPDVFTVQSADAKQLLQLDFTGERFTVQLGDALLTLGSSAASGPNALVSPGPFSLTTAGNPAAEHVTTAEAVAGILTQLLLALGAASPGPIIGAALAGTAPAIVATAMTTAGITPLLPPVAAAVYGAFGAATQKPPGVPGQGQLLPGLGASGLLTG